MLSTSPSVCRLASSCDVDLATRATLCGRRPQTPYSSWRRPSLKIPICRKHVATNALNSKDAHHKFVEDFDAALDKCNVGTRVVHPVSKDMYDPYRATGPPIFQVRTD